MRLSKLLIAFSMTLAILLPVGGCSSEAEKSPKVEGPVDPNIKPAGRGAGGAGGGPQAQPGRAPTQAPINKN